MSEFVGKFHTAAERGAAAIAALRRMQDDLIEALRPIGEARDIIDEAKGRVTSTTLEEYSTLLEAAHNMAAAISADVENVIGVIEEGQEKGEEFINRIAG